ncbi:MAG: tRNA pseudouridine(55) synthase TruB [Clostridiales bacterium]|nr:tRNA pseudouridine(55) synthase TruB [Clostridiales bacterium]
MNGVIVIDKPKDYTSFDVVAIVRKVSGEKKIGHTGTLDPMATGVLPILLGSAAKAQSVLPNTDKAYKARLKLGLTTDTLDITGKVLTNQNSNIRKEEFENALKRFFGRQNQIPPMFSAIKVDGVRLYDLARKGVEIEREAREIYISKLVLNEFDFEAQTAQIEVVCSKGTYIRSLIDDIGKALDCGAVMTGLRRTCACGYNTDDALEISALKEMSKTDIEALLKPTESIFYSYPQISVSEAQATRFYNGGALDIERTALKNTSEDKKIYRVKTKDDVFLGLGITDLSDGIIKVFKHFESDKF